MIQPPGKCSGHRAATTSGERGPCTARKHRSGSSTSAPAARIAPARGHGEAERRQQHTVVHIVYRHRDALLVQADEQLEDVRAGNAAKQARLVPEPLFDLDKCSFSALPCPQCTAIYGETGGYNQLLVIEKTGAYVEYFYEHGMIEITNPGDVEQGRPARYRR